VDM
jgi:hypothetical protein